MPPFISDISYYRRYSFLGRRDNRNVIYSVALNSGLVTFLAVDPSLYKKKKSNSFFLFSYLDIDLHISYEVTLMCCQGHSYRKSIVCLPECSGDFT